MRVRGPIFAPGSMIAVGCAVYNKLDFDLFGVSVAGENIRGARLSPIYTLPSTTPGNEDPHVHLCLVHTGRTLRQWHFRSRERGRTHKATESYSWLHGQDHRL